MIDAIYKLLIPNGYVYNAFINNSNYQFKIPYVKDARIYIADYEFLFRPEEGDSTLTIRDTVLHLRRIVSTHLNTVVEVETIKFYSI